MFRYSTQWSLKACKKALRLSINSNTPTVAQIKTKMPTMRTIVLLYLHQSQKHTGLMHQITLIANHLHDTTKQLTPRPEGELCHRKHSTTLNELSWTRSNTKKKNKMKGYDAFRDARFYNKCLKYWGTSTIYWMLLISNYLKNQVFKCLLYS